MPNEVFFSSQSDEWNTPQEIFDELNEEFSFQMDAAATSENAKCPLYCDKEHSGLEADWGGLHVFCNPPYSQIAEWVAKAFYETRKDGTIAVLLIPARTDTRYFHDYILHRSEIRFIRKRIKFNGSKNNAPFPSMIVIFRGAKTNGR